MHVAFMLIVKIRLTCFITFNNFHGNTTVKVVTILAYWGYVKQQEGFSLQTVNRIFVQNYAYYELMVAIWDRLLSYSKKTQKSQNGISVKQHLQGTKFSSSVPFSRYFE